MKVVTSRLTCQWRHRVTSSSWWPLQMAELVMHVFVKSGCEQTRYTRCVFFVVINCVWGESQVPAFSILVKSTNEHWHATRWSCTQILRHRVAAAAFLDKLCLAAVVHFYKYVYGNAVLMSVPNILIEHNEIKCQKFGVWLTFGDLCPALPLSPPRPGNQSIRSGLEWPK